MVVASLAVSIIHQIYFLQTGPFLSHIGILDSQIGPAMTIGQFAEIITMAYLGFFLKRLGFHKVISIGIAAYCVRYAIFGTESFPVWVMVISQAFHGFCYAFFFAAAYIYVDKIADEVNKSFPRFMYEAFHAPENKGKIIKGGREIVASKGLYITKKRYAALIYDNEGQRVDVDGKVGKVKAMGLDLKRSDTPVFMQDFLSEILMMVLQEKSEKDILERISEFRTEFKLRPGYEKGSPKRANRIGDYMRKEQREGKANMPGHVRASINWNTLKRMNGDKYSQEIVDGMKVIVCKLKTNPLGYTSVAYPTDELRLPDWFKELPFDNDAMEETIIDNKLGNLIGVLNYDIASTLQKNTFNNLFDFGGADES